MNNQAVDKEAEKKCLDITLSAEFTKDFLPQLMPGGNSAQQVGPF